MYDKRTARILLNALRAHAPWQQAGEMLIGENGAKFFNSPLGAVIVAGEHITCSNCQMDISQMRELADLAGVLKDQE